MSTLPVIQPRTAHDTGTALPVSETFFSIQGEGKLTGVPSFFIRLAGCNLRCRWCDTAYASWDAQGDSQTLDQLLDTAATRPDVRHAVLTGGEPLMFPNATELTDRLRAAGLHLTIETAGTILPPAGIAFDLISISPKLSNSTPHNDPRDPSGAWAQRHESRRINLPVLQQLLDDSEQRGRDRQLKFVVSPATLTQDLQEIDALLLKLHNWSPDDILLMPEGVRTPAPHELAPIIDACMHRSWRFCPRLHIALWGNQRGR